MIRVTVYKSGETFKGFKVKGHSGYSKSGTDIVCSAVSILAYTLINSINLIAGVPAKELNIELDEEIGLISLVSSNENEKTNLLYRNFLVGIELLLEDYSEYITLKFEEV